MGDDRCKSRTTAAKKIDSYKVTNYQESIVDGSKSKSKFYSGYFWAEYNVSEKGVSKFHTTHAIASASNIYKVYDEATDYAM